MFAKAWRGDGRYPIEPAGRTKPPTEVTWLEGDDLTEPRAGWTPQGWYGYLHQLAERCQDVRPDRAAELRAAAGRMADELTADSR